MTPKNKEESIRGLMMFKLFYRKLQRGVLVSSSKGSSLGTINEEIEEGAKVIPEDVKQGHLAVIATKGGEPKRFIVELDYLSTPEFMSLLEQAEEEFGFQQKGVLTVPCQPEELQMILDKRRKRRMSTEW